MAQKIKILVAAKDPRFDGGVHDFVSMLLAYPSDLIEWEYFKVGDRYPGKILIPKLIWPIVDNVQLIFRLLRQDVHCLHVHPSLNRTAFLRDALLTMTARSVGLGKIIVSIHGWDDRFAEQISSSALYRFLLRQSFARCSIIIVLAQRFKKQLEVLGILTDRILVSTTMFDGRIFDGVEGKQNDGMVKLLFLSRFVKEKGGFELLQAFRKIHQQFPEAKLLLAGDGPERNNMEKYVKTHALESAVHFLGYIRGKDKASMLINSDVFVLPTYYGEGCPVSLLEAMAAGLPVVTAKVGGIPDIFINGRNGILLDSVTPESIADAAIRLLQNRDLINEIGRHNRMVAWNLYESRVVCKKILGVYQYVAAVSE